MRGLADSGQANIAEAQSQAAYGETISGLYGQKQAVEQQAVTQTQMIEQSVAAATTEANIQRATQQLQSDQQLFQEVQAIEDNKKAQIVTLTELALSGERNAADIRAMAEAYGITEEELTTVMNASRFFDPTGEVKFQERWNWEEVAVSTGTVAVMGAPFGGWLGAGIGAIAGFVIGVIDQAVNNLSSTMTVSGGGQEFSGTPKEVVEQINSYYAGYEGSGQIFAAIDGSFTGTADKIVFKYRGQSFNTYNEALQAYRDSSR